jgi:arylsulfatase A-like enzyme
MRSSRGAARDLLLVIVAVASVSSCGRREDRPSVVLITVDTLRPDHLGCYGYARGTSPAIDRFAAESTGFLTAAVPRGQTWPTLASIHTSLYPVTHGVRKNGQSLPPGLTTLAHVLRDEGYACAASLANAGDVDWPVFEIVSRQKTEDERAHAAALRWLADHAGEPFFLWIHYFAPHKPFDPPDPYVDVYDPAYEGTITGGIEEMQRIQANEQPLPARDLEHLIARYDGEIRWLDGLLEDLLATIGALGLDERTLVVFTSDHGEELYERNGYLHHSASIYDSVLKVPLLFRWPGAVPAGRWIRGIAESLDVAPTVLDLIGVDAPAPFEGQSLAPAIAGSADLRERSAYAEIEDRVVSVRTARFRFVHNPTDFDFPLGKDDYRSVYPIATEELYAHGDDPGERRNIADSRPDEARKLQERIERWQLRHDWNERSRVHRRRAIPADVRQSLEALGYVP